MAGETARVYFFYGEEDYLIEEGVKKILTKFVRGGTADFGRDIFYGDDASGSQIVNAAMAIPMLAKHKVVVVKQFDRLAQADQEQVARYCKRPAPHSILVLTARKVDFRKKVFANIRDLSVAVECKPLYDDQVVDYLCNYAATRGKKLHPHAAELLVTKLGKSLGTLINEVEKLIEFAGNKEHITPDEVDHVVGISRNFNVFELCGALGARDLKKSLFITRRMLEVGESPIYIVSSLTGYFARMWRIRALLRQGVSKREIGQLLRIHTYFLEKTVEEARRFSDEDLRRIFRILLEADLRLKTSYQKPSLVLELAVYEILQRKKQAA